MLTSVTCPGLYNVLQRGWALPSHRPQVSGTGAQLAAMGWPCGAQRLGGSMMHGAAHGARVIREWAFCLSFGDNLGSTAVA